MSRHLNDINNIDEFEPIYIDSNTNLKIYVYMRIYVYIRTE